MNLIGLMLAVGPAVSPTIGGVLLSTLGWHSIFLVMVAYGIVALLVMGLCCVETNTAPNPAQAIRARSCAITRCSSGTAASCGGVSCSDALSARSIPWRLSFPSS